MTGIQLLREVRADDKLKHLPFIMITAESKSENVVAAKQAGVSNYIVKPFSAKTLKSKMTSVLGKFQSVSSLPVKVQVYSERNFKVVDNNITDLDIKSELVALSDVHVDVVKVFEISSVVGTIMSTIKNGHNRWQSWVVLGFLSSL